MMEIPSMIIVVRAMFDKNNKYYPNVFLDECLCKLSIIQKCYLSEETDVSKTRKSKDCDIAHYW